MVVFLVSFFTLLDVQNADLNGECRSSCKFSGYQSGAYFQDTTTCWCGDRLQLRLPSKIKRIKASSVTVPYINAEDNISLPWEN